MKTNPKPNQPDMPDSTLTLYKASAGSGKTYTLTKEYLRHLLRPGLQARNILAITFTNAATSDMKRKIVQALDLLARGEYPDWQDLLTEAQQKRLAHPNGTENPDPGIRESLHGEIRKRASEKLSQILHRYQDFSIKTIDSFVQSIIKPFAFELGLPQNYTPQIEEDELGETITQALVDEFGRKGCETVSGYISAFLRKQEQEQKSLRITEPIGKVVRLLFNESSIRALEELDRIGTEDFQDIIGHIGNFISREEGKAREILQQVRRIIEENGLKADDFIEKSRGVYAWFSLSEPDMGKFSSPGTGIGKSVAKGILKNGAGCASELEARYRDLSNLDFSNYFLLKEVQQSIYALALLNHAKEILEEIKEKTSAIPISEFNRKIDKALAEEGNDFIFERCGTRYRHIFIDEFQDTSRLQWKNLRPLVENNLAQGNGCLLVGDPKQSIYRFRNADMEQFVDLCQGKGGMSVKLNNLKSNWRSSEGIIAFNNLFYRFIQEKFEFRTASAEGSGNGESSDLARTVYADHCQYYRNQMQDYPKEDPQAVRIYQIRNVDRPTAGTWYLETILEKILPRHAPRDIAILCRKNAHCRQIADFLVSKGYKVSTSESLLLSSHNGLKLVISSLKYLQTRETFYKAETYALAKQLDLWDRKTDNCGKPGTPAAADSGPESNVSEFFSENPHEQWTSPSLNERFLDLAQTYDRQAELYDTVEAVMRFWGMERETDQYLLCFLDQIREMGFTRIPDLVRWWTDYAAKTSVSADNATDSIRIMSIHKAKGLEFEVVVMPFLYDNVLRHDQVFWTGKEAIPSGIGLPVALVRYVKNLEKTVLAEDMAREKQRMELDNLNTLYVGTTRPCRKLYLLNLAPKKENSGAFDTNRAIARFVKEHPQYLEYEEDGSVLETSEGKTATEILAEAVPDQETERGIRKQANGIRPGSVRNPETDKEILDSRMESHPWRERLQAAHLDLTPDTPEQEWGNFIHKALSMIDRKQDKRIERGLETAICLYPRFRSRKEEARKEIVQVLEHPRLSRFFQGGYHVKNETGIALSRSETFVPDRILIREDRAVVLDYKTGEPNGKYRKQLANYKDILLRMGYAVCEAYIVYTGKTCRVEEV